ncbi:ABC transporter substrate-binding protein [Celeribacter neptunius]|uniref:Peptide/nickel transport system substrate-binding protein n=1 Tax=Celeribacter neptunius TaxID=588602 RepID=A0A1I3NRW3_9RHOB|nr:ABC transporter substrate-binding protein [Celeribacter neptunius]SFJ11710.1 peptide/nickel transport system substrate-binding protein [Celeribacter neptunius]
MSADKTKLRGKLRALWKEAHDFDPKDPLFGLSAKDMSGPVLSRRATLRLLAASGTLTAAHLMPGGLTAMAEAATPGGTLNCGWAGVAEIQTLDPAQIGQVLQFQITSNVLSGLMHIDADLVARGDLAETWTVSDDGLEYVFKLREGVTFHNGDAFSADDVLYTYARSSDPEQSIHSGVLANVASLEKLGTHEVKFTLKKPQASFLTKTLERASGRAMTIVCKGALESMGASDYGLAPVGTGPFKVTEHVLGQGVTLEKFADYYDPERPKLDKVTIKPIDGVEPLAAALEAGDIQYIGGNPIAPQLIDRFKANPDLVVDIKPGPGFQSVWMNPHRDPMKVTDFDKPLDELKKEPGFMVRLAMAKALDRDTYVQQASFGYALPAYGTINPAMAFYYDEGIAETSEQAFDPEGARALLAEAGYPGGKGFPELEMLVTPSGKRNGLVVANIFKQVLGITVNLAVKEFSVGIEDFNNMEFDMRLGGSGGDYDPDDGLIDWMISDSKFNGRTRDTVKYPIGYFAESEVDALSAQQAVTADPEARRELVRKANQLTSDKVACGFLYHPVDVLVYAKSVNVPAESRIPGLTDLDRVTLG